MKESEDGFFMQRAFSLAESALNNPLKRPIGAVVVYNNKIISEGISSTREHMDPTAHAEILAIRKGCIFLKSKYLDSCKIYVSLQPCPMCLSAILWSRIPTLFYACSREYGKVIGLRDLEIFEQICGSSKNKILLTHQLLENDGANILNKWKLNNQRK